MVLKDLMNSETNHYNIVNFDSKRLVNVHTSMNKFGRNLSTKLTSAVAWDANCHTERNTTGCYSI